MLPEANRRPRIAVLPKRLAWRRLHNASGRGQQTCLNYRERNDMFCPKSTAPSIGRKQTVETYRGNKAGSGGPAKSGSRPRARAAIWLRRTAGPGSCPVRFVRERPRSRPVRSRPRDTRHCFEGGPPPTGKGGGTRRGRRRRSDRFDVRVGNPDILQGTSRHPFQLSALPLSRWKRKAPAIGPDAPMLSRGKSIAQSFARHGLRGNRPETREDIHRDGRGDGYPQ